MGYHDLAFAIKQAKRISRAHNRDTRYVIYEDGAYHVASEVDMDTFFAGTPDSAIRFCTADCE